MLSRWLAQWAEGSGSVRKRWVIRQNNTGCPLVQASLTAHNKPLAKLDSHAHTDGRLAIRYAIEKYLDGALCTELWNNSGDTWRVVASASSIC
jgi:hypothetical protein